VTWNRKTLSLRRDEPLVRTSPDRCRTLSCGRSALAAPPRRSQNTLCFGFPRNLRRAAQLIRLAAALVALSGCQQERPHFNQVQFAVKTGNSDLARSSSATATLNSEHGRVRQQVTLKGADQPGWKIGTTHTATFQLKPKMDFCDVDSVDLTLHPSTPVTTGSTWSVEKASATLSIDGVDRTVLLAEAGNPLATLTADHPTLRLRVICKKQENLYERLGEKSGIASVVNDFAQRLAQDNRISQFFSPIANDHERLEEFKERFVRKMCELSGGPCEARGESPFPPLGNNVTAERAIIEDLVAAMAKFPATASTKDKNELLGAPLIDDRAAGLRTAAPSAAAGVVGGGIASPIFANLYWDTTWDADNAPAPKEAFDSYIEAVIGSTYFAGLSQYGVGTPMWGGSFLPSPDCTAKAPTSVGFYDPANPSIIGFLQCELDNDTSVPQGDGVVYNIILPQTSTESDAISGLFGLVPLCVADASGHVQGAWHFHGTPYSTGEVLGGVLGFIFGGFVGDPVQGAIIGFLAALSDQGGPFYTISSASTTAPLNCGNLTNNVVHEMVEAVSDPSPPLSVISTGTGEIADVCSGAPASSSWVPTVMPPVSLTGGFLMVQVPQYMSNATMACIPGFSSMTKPNIKTVTLNGSFPASKVLITGSGFGSIGPPFVIPTSANLPFLGIQDQSQSPTWQAGNSLNMDNVGLTITNWSDTSISISGFSPAAGSNVAMQAADNLTAWVCNPGSGACDLKTNPAGTGGSGLNSADILSLGITITTGDDDARADTELWLTIPAMGFAACLKPSNNANPSPVCPQNGGSATDQNGRQGWGNGSTDPAPQVFALTMPAPVLPGMNIQLISHNHGFENDDNWDIQAITVTGTTRGGTTSTLLSLAGPMPPNSGNCIARLKAAPNASTVVFTVDGTNGHTYLDGTPSERGAVATCTNNGDQ
jgi:hemoglobin